MSELPVILRSVQSIESLFVIAWSPKNWKRLGDEASSALLDCLSRPSLRRFELSNVFGVPAALILAATAIPVVEFKSVSMAQLGEDISEQLHASAPVPRLRHLILGNAKYGDALRVCNLLLHPQKPAYTQQIERLEIHINQHSANYDERIMAACAATLKYLAVYAAGMLLCLDSEWCPSELSIDLIRLPLLPSVLGVEINVSVGDHRRLPTCFSSNISQIASSLPLVETITLMVFVDPHHPGPEIEWPDEAPLPIFGPSFMDRTQLLHLRRVYCILRPRFDTMTAAFDHFVPAMESRMPGLRDTGILECILADPTVIYKSS
jgi:hypothetical protein